MGRTAVAVCVLVVCLVTVNAWGGRSQPDPPRRTVHVARLAGFDDEGTRVPYKYSRSVNHDYQWHRINGANAGPGEISSFKAYADEIEDEFEKEMLVCHTRTKDVSGQQTDTNILRPGEKGSCSKLGSGWRTEFNFYVADSRKENTQQIFFATCQRRDNSRTLYTKISTHNIDCGADQQHKLGSFFAKVGPMPCEIVHNPPHSQRTDVSSSGGILRSFSLECQHGYTMNGPSTLNCRNGQWDSEPPTCTEIFCGPPPTISNGRPTQRGPYPFMTETSYECATGYELNPPFETIQCTQSGEWTQRTVRCLPVDCGFPGNVEYGDVSQGPYTFDRTVDFSCDSGYALHGAASATCLENARWSHITPTCRQIRCSNLLHPEHGTLLMSDFKAGSEVIVQCHTGYQLEGSDTLSCQQQQDGETAEWVGETPHCERITCEAPEAPEHGSVGGSDFQYDAQVTYSCSVGYILRGSDRAQCTEEGWDVETPTCEVLRCRDPGTPERAEREVLGSFDFGTIVKYTCGSGSILDGSQTLLCTEEGRWNEEPPTCEPVHCTPLDPPEHGASEVDSFVTGGVAEFTCSPGYELEGPEDSECQDDGTWSHPVPECRPCQIGSYKEGANEEKCQRCPVNSDTTTMASFSRRHCMCVQGTTGDLGGPCEAIVCEPLVAPEGGSLASCGHNNNDECHFDCDPGFYLQGSRIRKCSSTGWTGNPPICSACPANTYKTHAAAMTCIPCPRNSGTYDGLGISLEACTCSPGFQGPAGGPCEDVDECSGDDNGGCSQGCINTAGSHYCLCTIPGYELGDDGVTCHKNRTCEDVGQHPAHGSLNCRYTEDTNGYICHIGCEETYFFVSGTNNYITCGSDTDFVWSHQVMNRTARLPSCTKEFFVDVDLAVKLQYSSDDSCGQQASIMNGHIKAQVQDVVDSIPVCDTRCKVHDLSTTCVTDQQTGQVTLQVDLKVMIKNPEENAVTPGCEMMCQRQNMRQIISDAFNLTQSIEAIVRDEPQRLNIADYEETELNSGFYQHGRPDLLCEPGRVYTRNRLCVPCDAGFHHPERSLDTCIPCPLGTYQDLQGQTFCKPCLPGTSTHALGADHPVMCAARVEYNVTTPEPTGGEDEGDYSDEGDYGDEGFEAQFL